VNPIGVFQRKDRCVDECFSWRLGGLQGLVHVRSILQHWRGGTARPEGNGSAYQAFDENENLKDESQQAIMQLGSKLATVTAKLNT